VALSGAGAREAKGTGALTLPAVTVAGEGRLAVEITGTGALTLPKLRVSGTNVVAFGGALPGRRVRRTKAYEEYLRALAEGREVEPPQAELEAPKRPKTRRPQRQPAPALPDFPAYGGDFLADIAAQPAIATVLDLEAYRTYAEAYAAAQYATLLWQEDEELLMLLVA
jgi:hypothetical protein